MNKPSAPNVEKTGTPLPAPDHRLTLRSRQFKLAGDAPVDDEQFEMRFFEEILSHDPCNEDALMVLGYAYTRRGDYRRGLDMDRRLARLRPADATACYNLACSYALTGDLDGAFASLERAVGLGYHDLAHLLKDPDLAPLRQDTRFRRLLQRMVGSSSMDS